MKKRILLSSIALTCAVLGVVAQTTTASSSMTASPWEDSRRW